MQLLKRTTATLKHQGYLWHSVMNGVSMWWKSLGNCLLIIRNYKTVSYAKPERTISNFFRIKKWASIYLFIHPSIHPPTHPYIHHFIYLSVTKILAEHRRHPLLWYEESEIQIRLSHGLSLLLLVAKSCPTLLQPMDCSPPDSSVHGIFQARTLEWAAISFSRGSSQSRDWICVSCIGRWIVYHWATW